jgi:hypothetical protein
MAGRNPAWCKRLSGPGVADAYSYGPSTGDCSAGHSHSGFAPNEYATAACAVQHPDSHCHTLHYLDSHGYAVGQPNSDAHSGHLCREAG